jgi:exosortase
MTEGNTQRRSLLQEILDDVPTFWKAIPHKGLFVSLLAAWVVFFDFFGDPIFGYYHSIFFWAILTYNAFPDDQHGLYIPLVILGLFWWKREELKKVQSRLWLPGLSIICSALLVHMVGYVIQQPRISLVSFFLGVYGIIGVVWGPAVLKASFFPMCLLAFAIPISAMGEFITFPLRLFATKVTFVIADTLGVNIMRQGTQLMDRNGSFQFEVAAACSGLRSLTATAALCTIFAFMNLKKTWKKMVMILAAVPLAIAGNILRLMTLITVSELFGRKVGEMVHESTFFSLLPYVPGIVGILVLGHLLQEKDPASSTAPPEREIVPVQQPA